MSQATKSHDTGPTPKDIKEFKDDDLSQKGRTKHIVETDWPTKESIPVKKRKIKKTQDSRLP